MVDRKPPRLIRRIGFGYKLDFMPAPLIVGYHSLAKKIEQAKFNVLVLLVPLNNLTPEWDLLFIPKEFENDVAGIVAADQVIVLDEFLNQALYTDLVKRLEEGKEIYAERIQPDQMDPEKGITVRYRGYDRID